MIEFQRFSVCYPNQRDFALHEVTLALHDGAFALVMGESGAGKSTLLRSINGLVPHFSGGQVSGQVRVRGQSPIQLGPQHMSRTVGFVMQDPEAQFVLDTVEAEIAFAMENAAVPRQDMRIRVESMLDLLGIAHLRQRRVDTLSGGEQQRVAIASALALQPSVLVLDEPTSQLDPQSAEDVLQALVRLNADLGLTVILSEHRLERVLPFVDTVVHVLKGQTNAGEPRTMLHKIESVPPLLQVAKALAWEPLPLSLREGRRFSIGLATSQSAQASSRQPSLGRAEKPVLVIERLEAGYANQSVLKGLSFHIWPGQILAILGRNGSGKSTLLKTLVGLLKARRGSIKLDGNAIQGWRTAEICTQVGYLPQDPNTLLFAESVYDELRQTLVNHRQPPDQHAETIARMLQQLHLTDLAQAYPRDLSVGQRQRVALGAIAITQPRVLLLDEPTRGLDYHAKRTLSALLKTWQHQGTAIVVVSHDVEFVAEVAERALILSQGEIVADGPTAEVLSASSQFAPQVTRLFPSTGWLTVDDVLQGLKPQ